MRGHSCLIYYVFQIHFQALFFAVPPGGWWVGVFPLVMAHDILKYLPEKPKFLQNETKRSRHENPGECLSRVPPR